MIVLDTDVVTLLLHADSAEAIRISARIAELPPDADVGPTIVSYQEQTRGWIAYIGKARTVEQQVYAYGRLEAHLNAYRDSRVVPFDRAAALLAEDLRHKHPRMGTMDLRIAAIALSRDALLVTRNVKDFAPVDGLRIEDWTKP